MLNFVAKRAVSTTTYVSPFISVKAAPYNATGDGTTNDTTAIDAARTAARAVSGSVSFPPGTYIYDGASITTSEVWKSVASGLGQATIKRSTTSSYNTFITATVPVEFEGIVFDGNKAGNAHATTVMSLTGVSSRLTKCSFNNGKASSGYGDGLLIRVPAGTSTRHIIDKCDATGNDNNGMTITSADKITITDCHVYSNGNAGIFLRSFDLTLSDQDTNVIIRGNNCHNNTTTGIVVGDFVTDNSTTSKAYGYSNPDGNTAIVESNICNNNGGYGMSFANFPYSICRGNIVNGNQNGILATCSYSIIANNVCNGNTQIGIDAGWGLNILISGNHLSANGKGLNAPLTRSVIDGNYLYGNTGSGMWIQGADNDGSQYSTAVALSGSIANNLTVSNNFIDTPTGIPGIYALDNPIGIVITGNTVRIAGSAADNAMNAIVYVGAYANAQISDNKILNGILTLTPSSGILYVPDGVDQAATNSTTTITGIRSSGQYLIGVDGVGYATVTTQGTGYTNAATISFSGGGGTGAAAQPIIYLPTGAIVAIHMTNHGSGYTSAPTIAFNRNGGSGTAAVATANLSCDIPSGRRVSITCLQAETFQRNPTGGPTVVSPSGADHAISANGTLDILSAFGHWYVVAKS